MLRASPVMEALARRYERSIAGRTGQATRDVLVDVEDLLRDAGAVDGDLRDLAEQQLREAAQAGICQLEPLHKRDRASLHQVRFSPVREFSLYDFIGRPSPGAVRGALSEQFAAASAKPVPERWRDGWTSWCECMRAAAMTGKSIEPFDRHPTQQNEKLLDLLPRLLAWEGESLLRFASCVLCGDSKTLESLSAPDRDGEFRDKPRGKLGRLLEAITGGRLRALDDLGILPNPRFALVHGPIKLQLAGEWLDFGLLKGAFRLAEVDILRAACVATTSRRCLTVENETSFHELAKLQSGTLLIQTSYPGSGTVSLLQRLPDDLEYWHFGDSDEAGFEILKVLRAATGRDFQPLHMRRGRVPFEQESMGRPTLSQWPFYE